MATFVDSVSYDGKQSYEFFSGIIQSEFSSRKDWKNISTIKNEVNIPQMGLVDFLQEGTTCEWNESGTYSVSNRTVEVCPYYVNLTICKKDIEPSFISEKMKGGQYNGEIAPREMTDYLINNLLKEKVLYELEYKTWQGLTTSCTGGLVLQAKDDVTVHDVSATASTITSANVIGEINRALDGVPTYVREKSDFVLYISREIAFAYRQAILASVGPYHKFEDKATMTYGGYTLKETPGLGAKEMFGTHLDNLWNVNDLSTDEQNVIVADMSAFGELKARIAMAFKFTAAYGIGDEVMLYS